MGVKGTRRPRPPSPSSIPPLRSPGRVRTPPRKQARGEGVGGARSGPIRSPAPPAPPAGAPPRPHRLVRLHADLEGLLLQRLQRHGHRHGGTGTGRRRLLPAAPQHATHAAAILGGPAASAAAPETRHGARARLAPASRPPFLSRDTGTARARGGALPRHVTPGKGGTIRRLGRGHVTRETRARGARGHVTRRGGTKWRRPQHGAGGGTGGIKRKKRRRRDDR